MSKPCADVPDQLWISDSLKSGAGGNHGHLSKLPWTPKLVAMAYGLREDGETWPAIAQALFEETGVLLAARGLADYMQRNMGEK